MHPNEMETIDSLIQDYLALLPRASSFPAETVEANISARESAPVKEFESFLLNLGILPEFILEAEGEYRFNVCHQFPTLKSKFILGTLAVNVGTRKDKKFTETDFKFQFAPSSLNPAFRYHPTSWTATEGGIPEAKEAISSIHQQIADILTENNISTSKASAFLILKAHTFSSTIAINGFVARERTRRFNLKSEALILDFLKTDMGTEEIAYWLAVGSSVEEALTSKGIPVSFLNTMDPVIP